MPSRAFAKLRLFGCPLLGRDSDAVSRHLLSIVAQLLSEIAIFMSSAFNNGTGSGSALDPAILRVAVVATFVATLVSSTSIFMHLKNYRKPMLQR